MSLFLSLFISLLGGLSVKVYDDLNDNIILRKFRNDTFMEFLKGLHFISFTAISIEEPLFFIISYVGNLMNYLGNNEAFSEPYEHSILYSVMILFIILDYKKITDICLLDKLLMVCMCSTMFIEPIIMHYFFKNSEFSFQKMIIRSLLLICVTIYCFLSESRALKYVFSYFIGYFTISVLVQCYSLITINKEEKEEVLEKEEVVKEEILEKEVLEKEVLEKEVLEKEDLLKEEVVKEVLVKEVKEEIKML